MGYSKHIKIKGQEQVVSALVNKFVDIITSTMGPGGHVAIIQSEWGTMATKDGVTVSKYIAPRDTFERMISQLIVDASNRTVKEVGDGTTTTACLLGAMYHLWNSEYKKMAGDILEFLSGMDNAVSDVLTVLKDESKKIVVDGKIDKKALMNVAMISCNGDKDVAGMLSDLIYEVGQKGKVSIKKNVGNGGTYTEHIPGYTFDTMLLGRHHLKDRAEGEEVLHKPLFVLAAENLESADNHVQPIINTWLSSVELKSENGGLRPLVIMCTGLVGSARTFVSANAEAYPIYVVQMPLGGKEGYEMMKDIKEMTGAYRVYNKQIGGFGIGDFGVDFEAEDESVYDTKWKEFGSADKVIVGGGQCSIVPVKNYDPSSRVKLLEMEMQRGDKSERELDFMKQRIASLVSGIGVVHVGANSDTEAHRIAHLVDDGQRACFTALNGGVVSGAGRAFHYAGTYLSHEMGTVMNIQAAVKAEDRRQLSYWAGYDMILTAIIFPAVKLFSNYYSEGEEESVGRLSPIVEENKDELKSFWAGWNIEGFVVKNLFDTGIIDPYLVCESALKNAVSVVKQLIHSKYVLVEDKQETVKGDNDLDSRIDKESIKELYRRMDMLKKM